MSARRLVPLALATALAASLAGAARPGATSWWVPAQRATWQIQFTGSLDQSVSAQMFDVDLFDTPATAVASLHAKGRRVVCYVSAGSWEDWRPDASRYPEAVKGRSNGWAGERWLDVRRLDVLGPILRDRLELCSAKGFDAVDFDNVDGYTNATGFPLTAADQLAFNSWLADEAHARGLGVGLKNDLLQIPDLVSRFDFAVVEQCFQYAECNLLAPFVQAGKAVFEIEYRQKTSRFCPKAAALGFSAMRKRPALDAWRQPCP